MKPFINPSPLKGKAWQLTLLGALLAVSAGAQAAGTAAGTDITNIARLSYDVGGTPQGDLCSSDTGNSTADTDGTCTNNPGKTTFRVDNKIDVLVAESDATKTTVVAGQQNAVTTFTVTNQGNQTQDFALTTANLGNGSTAVAGVTGTPFTDNFTAANCTIALASTTGVATFSSTGGDHIDALAPDETATVTVTCDIPAAQADGSAAVVYLGATAHANDSAATLGGALTETVANDPAVEDIVFADDAGSDDITITADADGVRDATHSARDVYSVSTATMTVTKVMATVCDPVNGGNSDLAGLTGTNVFNIPGAVVRWTLTVANTGSASANLNAVADALNANTTFDPDYITGAGGAAGCEFAAAGAGTPTNANGDGVKIVVSNSRNMAGSVGGTTAVPVAGTTSYYTGAPADDGVTVSGAVGSESLGIDFTLALPAGGTYGAGELKAGESITVTFNVGIN